jgi:hypothetical protein
MERPKSQLEHNSFTQNIVQGRHPFLPRIGVHEAQFSTLILSLSILLFSPLSLSLSLSHLKSFCPFSFLSIFIYVSHSRTLSLCTYFQKEIFTHPIQRQQSNNIFFFTFTFLSFQYTIYSTFQAFNVYFYPSFSTYFFFFSKNYSTFQVSMHPFFRRNISHFKSLQ